MFGDTINMKILYIYSTDDSRDNYITLNKMGYLIEEYNRKQENSRLNNEEIELIKHEHIEEEINHCTLFKEKYNNYFANGLLSGNRKSKNFKI